MRGRVTMLAFVAMAAAAGAAAAPWRLVAVEGTTARAIGSAEAGGLPPGTPVWAWSADCAPERLAAPLPEVLPCSRGVELAVRALDGRRRPLSGMRVLVAPAAMRGEVPDALLPSVQTGAGGVAAVRVPEEGPVWVRLASARGATLWRRVRAGGGTVTLVAAPAASLGLEIEPSGGGDETVWVEVLDAGPAARPEPFARAVGPPRELTLPPLPRGLPVTVLAWGERSAPVSRSGVTGASLPALRLPPGARLLGRVSDDAGRPVAGASVEAVFRLPRLAEGMTRRATAGEDGGFELPGLPAGAAVVTVSHAGWVPRRRELDLTAGGDVELEVTLERARRVTVVVRDPAGRAVAGAALALEDGPELGRTGADGRAVLPTVPRRPVRLEITARGFLPGRLEVPERVEAPLDAVLERAAGVRARFVFADTGEPAGPGRVRWESTAGESWVTALPPSGELEEMDLRPGTWSLEVAPAGARPVRWEGLELAGGEPLDLGEVRVERGLAIAGVVFDDRTGAPVAGARVRTLRPDPLGPRFAALQEEWLDAETDAEGRFRLEGLEPATYTVLISAPGHAPRLVERIEVAEDAPDGVLELDPVWLEAPHRLEVRCTPAARCGDEAVLLLGSPLAEWASVRAPQVEGVARLEPVPAGERTLRLLEGGWVATERRVTVDPDEDATVVEISLEGTHVTGEVTLAGEPAAGGAVALEPGGGGGGVPEVIVEERLPGQRRASQTVLTGRGRTITAAVDSAGRFEARDVPAGRYEIVYVGPQGWRSPARAVEIREAEEQHVVLAFDGGAVRGRVVDAEGRAAGRAAVSVRDAGGHRADTASGPDGTFRLGGLAPGRAVVRARAPEGEAEAAVEVRPGETAEVELVLEPPAGQLAVTVLGPDGEPVAGALVMALGPDGGGFDRTDVDGRVTFEGLGSGGSVALAAYRAGLGFAFGRAEPGAGGATVTFAEETGTLAIEAGGPMRAVTVAAPGGFPLERLLPLVGLPPAVGAEAPLELSGLPPGLYTVGLPGAPLRQASVRGGERTEVDLGG